MPSTSLIEILISPKELIQQKGCFVSIRVDDYQVQADYTLAYACKSAFENLFS